jgi:hypothetical protein
MSTVLRTNRKGSDQDIIRLNAIGLSLATIAKRLECHPTSITLRLKALNIEAADTRRAFMESILKSLPEDFSEALADHLTDGELKSIKQYVKELIVKDIQARKSNPTLQCAAE